MFVAATLHSGAHGVPRRGPLRRGGRFGAVVPETAAQGSRRKSGFMAFYIRLGRKAQPAGQAGSGRGEGIGTKMGDTAFAEWN